MSDGALATVLIAMIGGAIRVSTPFMFVALGETITEKSGRINLGLEGTLVLGAMVAYMTSYRTGSPWLGVLGAGGVGMALGAMHGFVCKLPRVNDVAIGIAMMSFGVGLAFFFGKPYIQPTAPRLPSVPIGEWLGVTPALRQALDVNPLFLVGLAMAVFLAWGFRNTQWGLILRTTGDSAPAARAMGISVDLVRFLATAAGGFLAGIAGAFLSLYYPGLLERGAVVGPGPDGGGARHLRALGPAQVRGGRAAVRRGRRARAGAAVDRRHAGLLLLQRGALHPHPAHHGRLGRLQARHARRAGRALHDPMTKSGSSRGQVGKRTIEAQPVGSASVLRPAR